MKKFFFEAVNLYFNDNPDCLGIYDMKEMKKQADKFRALYSHPTNDIPEGLAEAIISSRTFADYSKTKAEYVYERILYHAADSNWPVGYRKLTAFEATVLQLEYPELLNSRVLIPISSSGVSHTLADNLLLSAREKRAECKSTSTYKRWLERVLMLKPYFNISITEIIEDSGDALLHSYPEKHQKKLKSIIEKTLEHSLQKGALQ